MPHRLPAFLRLFSAFVLLLGLGLPAAAQVTIFSPFNLSAAVDQGVRKHADVPYADGQRKKLDVYRPAESDGSAPVVMFIYGGGWRAGDRFEYEFVGRALAAQGFVTVIADYRIFPEVRYPEFLEDNARPSSGSRTISPAMAATPRGSSSPGIRRAPTMP